MMRTEEEMVAYALEVEVSLLSHIPELLADLEELGSDAKLIVQVLRELDLPEDSRVIDLGCGKGATAVEIAASLGYRVLGVDLFEPFVEASRVAASAAGVAELCEFRYGNILKLVGKTEPADVVVFSALSDVLGPLDATVGVIRSFAKPGGVILISDGCLKEGASVDFPGYENYVGHDDSVRRLTAYGDSLEREVAEPATTVNPDGADEVTLIRARAEQIAQRHPELRRDLLGYAEDQAAEYAFLEAHFAGLLWVLRKTQEAASEPKW